jgi:hypothetical protein
VLHGAIPERPPGSVAQELTKPPRDLTSKTGDRGIAEAMPRFSVSSPEHPQQTKMSRAEEEAQDEQGPNQNLSGHKQLST